MGRGIDIVIDLETLGTRPGCVILEIGACAIDNRTGVITKNFSRRIDRDWTFDHLCEMLVDGGLPEDVAKTVQWWLDDAGRANTLRALLSGTGLSTHMHTALCEFANWFEAASEGAGSEEVRIWANGPSFDIAILQGAYDGYDVKRPWICWQERCVRTALEMAGYEKGSTSWMERGPRHRALNDARHEARKLFYSGALGEVSAIIRRLKQSGTLPVERYD